MYAPNDKSNFMSSSNCIEQKGIIEEIDKGIAKVNITSFSACSGCHSKAACNLSESAEKQIEVPLPDENQFKIGETVGVLMKRVMGWKATLLAYGLPFILVMITLLTLSSLNFHEVIAGLAGLAILVPYFIILYIMRERLKTAFSFSLRKMI